MRFLKSIAICALTIACSSITAYAGESTEPISGIPLYPGATMAGTTASQSHCGVSMRSAQYEIAKATIKPAVFFRSALPGATSWTFANGAVTAFLRADGKALVKILRMQPSENAFSLVYGSYSKPVTERQVRAGSC